MILSVVGARPQFIKAAVVSAALKRAEMGETIVHTGQHFDSQMSDVFFEELEIPKPAHHLGVGAASPLEGLARMIHGLEKIIRADSSFKLVLVYGDTTSTLAGALAAAKLNLPLAHVEGGMRSFNRAMPEETNRILTDHIAQLHFVTNETPKRWLAAEGISENVHVVGDVMYDAVEIFRHLSESKAALRKLNNLKPKSYGLVTVHRAENTGDPKRLHEILSGLEKVSEEIPLVFPMHPRTKKLLAAQKQSVKRSKILVVDPVGYFEMLGLESNAKIILTDSGGVQKEAFFLKVPCITLRNETEWVETVDLGWNRLAGQDPGKILDDARSFLKKSPEVDEEKRQVYGDGKAADRIGNILRKVLQ